MKEKHILLVDDDTYFLNALGAIVRMFCPDCQTILVNNGTLALQELRQESITLMLTDYELPDMNGLELVQAVRAASPDTRVVLVTGRSKIAAMTDRMNASNLDGYLQKPFSLEQIWNVLQATTKSIPGG